MFDELEEREKERREVGSYARATSSTYSLALCESVKWAMY
jgi:hypothetical protein